MTPMTMFKLNCGDTVKDKATGATGRIVIRSECMSGNIRYAVRPLELKDGKPADYFWIDEAALEVTLPSGDTPTDRVFLFNLGDEVHDVWSDLRGVIQSRADHQYGCRRYEVQPRQIVEGKLAQGYSLDEGAVALVLAAVPAAKPQDRPGAEGLTSLPERSVEGR